MDVFLEKFLLPILATSVIAVVVINPLKLDIRQRISLTVAVVALAYFVAHSLNRQRLELVKTPAGRVETPKASGNASTSGQDSPAVTGDGNKIDYDKRSGETKPKPPK